MAITDEFKKQFLKGSAAASIGQIVSMVFHFGSIVLLTRFISKEEFGIYALILVINYLFIILSSLGLDVTLVKFISSNEETDKYQTAAPVFISQASALLLLSVIFYLTSRFILSLFDESLMDYALYIPILFLFSTFRDTLYRILQGLGYFKRYATIQVASAFIRVSLIVVFILNDMLSLQNLIFVEILTVFLTDFIQLFMIPFKNIAKKGINKSRFKVIFKFALPIYFNNIFTFMYGRINLFIIGALLNPVSVALFDVADKIPDAMNRLFHSFILVYFPNISNLLSKNDKESAENLMNKSLVIASLFLASIALGAFLFKEEIVVLIFSEKYFESAMAFALLAINFNIRAIENILGYSILSAGYSSIPMKVNIVSSAISVAGSLIMIPQVGFIGAVYALLIMNTVAQFLYFFYLKKYKFNPKILEYWKPIVMMIAAILIFILLDINTILIKSIITVGFFVLAWIFISEFRFLFRFIFEIKSYLKK